MKAMQLIGAEEGRGSAAEVDELELATTEPHAFGVQLTPLPWPGHRYKPSTSSGVLVGVDPEVAELAAACGRRGCEDRGQAAIGFWGEYREPRWRRAPDRPTQTEKGG